MPFAVLALFVAGRMGITHLWATVETPAGPVTIPNGFAGVDHPFHTVRAELLRRSLADGHWLRWVGQHQAGYPVEFYPLGAAWLAVAVWVGALGALPIEAAYVISVWLIFLLSGIAWIIAARRDRLPVGIALLALAIHVSVPGAWWHGGYTELVQWGLVTNVAASVCALFALVWIAGYLAGGRPAIGALAMAAAAGALFTNPRSGIALVAIGLASIVSRWLSEHNRRSSENTKPSPRLWRPVGRILMVAVGSALLAAPELVAMARFGGLYQFVRYGGYDNVGAWWESTVTAVSAPVLVAAIAGIMIVWLDTDRPVTRAAALTLPLYAGLTLLAATNPDRGWLEQLEATRLMPFQRLLTIWLGAYGVVAITSGVWRRVDAGRRHQSWSGNVRGPDRSGQVLPRSRMVGPSLVANGAALLLALAVVAWWVRPGPPGLPLPGPPEAPPRGLYSVSRSGVTEQAAFAQAVTAADTGAASGTALLVLGSGLSWHQQLWAPLWTDRPLFYDNWLWYWHFDHAGPPGYEPLRGHDYPQPELALDAPYLADHGIGGAVITGPSSDAAAVSSRLAAVKLFDSYGSWIVQRPTALVSSGGLNATAISFANERIAATLAADGDVTIRHNWYPRWRATLNGRPVPVERTNDGGMRVPSGAAGDRMELVYGVDGGDWLARGLTVGGILGIALWLAFHRRPAPRR